MINFDFGVTLRPLDTKYAAQIREWRNHPSIMRWCRQSDLISDQAQDRWFRSQDQDPTIQMYAIETDSLVGVCGFTSIDRLSRRAEFSLYIAPEYQLRGHAKAALKTLFTHGFMNQNLNVIWGESFDGNPAIGLFLQLGMKQEGTRRNFYFKNGKFVDAHLFSILFDEWKDQKW
jgi:RimJ/RimL family protein N-acetyltransferase